MSALQSINSGDPNHSYANQAPLNLPLTEGGGMIRETDFVSRLRQTGETKLRLSYLGATLLKHDFLGLIHTY